MTFEQEPEESQAGAEWTPGASASWAEGLASAKP